MAQFIRTFSDAYLQRHRNTHVRHAEFGTHRHPYLHDTMRRLVAAITTAAGDTGEAPSPEAPSLLDYGCGKGVFVSEMTRLKLFRYIRGYDPAVAAFKVRPAQRYDIVTCLDVLDQLEDAFIEPAIRDVAQFTGRFAVFNVITRQSPQFEHLNPRSAVTWGDIIGRHMLVSAMTVRPSTSDEIAQGACPERVIITAELPVVA